MIEIPIRVADVEFSVELEDDLENIGKYLNTYFGTNTPTAMSANVNIYNSDLWKTSISADKRSLSICGKDIDNISDPYNLIGVLASIIRFGGIYSIENGSYLLHGSSALYQGETFLFGDDGSSIAKTLSTIECCLVSKEFIGDEFIFFRPDSRDIFGYDFIPIHIRPRCINHLNSIHGTNYIADGNYGKFMSNKDMGFKYKERSKLGCFIFVHFGDKNKSVELKSNEKLNAIETTIASPLLKLIHPEFDRMSFSSKKDSCSIIEMKDTKRIIDDFNMREGVEKVLEIPAYSVYLRQPCDITKMLDIIIPSL